MKTFFKISLLFFQLVAIVSCNQETTSTSLSSVAQITAFSFTANDSFPGLGEAVFVVNQYYDSQLGDTGLIRMRENDSIRYGTPLDSVIPNITYYSTPSSVTFYLGDSAVALTGYDTLDLSKKPIYIYVVAQNTDYKKWYKLDVRLHTVDGDLFHWDTVATFIPEAYSHGTQKALVRRDRFYYYQNDGYGVQVFTSDNEGEDWNKQTISGLPNTCNVRNIVESDSMFFYGKDHDLYYSNDGFVWNHTTTKLDIMALYMCLKVNNPDDPIRLWMAARDTLGVARFYTVGLTLSPQVERGIGLPGDTLPIDFPVQDYATIPFQSSSLHQHALIAGGYCRNDTMTNARWSLEYNEVSKKYHLYNLAKKNSTLTAFAGSSTSYYGQYLYLLGGIHADRSFLKNTYASNDEGVNWVEVTDTLNRKRPEKLQGRFRTNTFVHNLNLYIIGGEDNSTTYSDVYRGRMNSIAWPEIGN